ncbi:MAG TPA: type VI secretion system tube protein TssD [Hymenobacter sp.]|jgi:hypothetical protein
MTSITAELHVNGRIYPVLKFTATHHQDTHERGYVTSLVRPGPVELTLDVAVQDTFLPGWAYDPFRHHEANILCRDADGGSVAHTLHLPQAYCVGYDEHFVAGDTGGGSFQCQVTLVAPDGQQMIPGAPGKFVAPAARNHGIPPVAALAPLAAVVPPAALTKQQRYDARMSLMGNAQSKLANSPDEAAQTALTRLTRNNVAVERARLSEHAYHSDKFELDELGNPTTLCTPEPEGWHMLNPSELKEKYGLDQAALLDPKSGFKAALYLSSFERPPKLIIAYAGTEDKKDIIADLQQGTGLKNEQYNRAMKLADAVLDKVDKDEIETTGHSLGGGLASAATVVTGVKGYTFNAAGLHANTVKRPPYGVSRTAMQEQGALIDAYRSTSDPLNNIQNGLNFPKGYIAPKALGTSYPVTPAPKWQHTWPELVKSNPLKAAKAMALHGHGVNPQMVDHIEHEKDQDTATLTNYLAP